MNEWVDDRFPSDTLFKITMRNNILPGAPGCPGQAIPGCFALVKTI